MKNYIRHYHMSVYFDKLRKLLTTNEQKELLHRMRIQYNREERSAIKLEIYLSDTLDGMRPEQSARENKLI